MKQLRHSILITVIAWVCFASNSCSQAKTRAEPDETVFFATTPYLDAVQKLLHISAVEKYEMMKWHLKIRRDPSTHKPATFVVECKYGMAKQGTRGFADGAQEIILKGKWTISEVGAGKTTHKLVADGSPVSLTFIQIGPNLLHLVDGNGQMLIGNGAWSYTFNRTDPIPEIPAHVRNITSGLPSLPGDSTVVGSFDGRMPCNDVLAGLHNISLSGCQVTKCRLILYKDMQTNQPTSFQLYTIYVGKGDNRYVVEGSWKILEVIGNEPITVIYELKPASGSTKSLSFFKADDNVLFLLDQAGSSFLVGNEYSSYTLNRNKTE